jgi:hypothetical protein
MLMPFGRFWNRSERKARSLRKRPTPQKQKPRTRPTLEALEDRFVPTVAFTPQLGNGTLPSVISNNQQQDLQNPPVVLIFDGSQWNSQNEQPIISAVQSIISGPYLSKLTQYHASATAPWGGSWQTTQQLTVSDGDGGHRPAAGTLQTFLQNEINANPGQAVKGALYVVITDPQDSNGANGAAYGENYVTDANGNRAMYVGTAPSFSGGLVAQDTFTTVFSHELAESMAQGVTVTDPGNTGGGNQIADNEPDNFATNSFYDYRLNGNLVQAYWSQNDGAFVVPDGNTQKFTLNPLWSNGQFTGQYNLYVIGDQIPGNPNDQISLGQNPDPNQSNGVQVTMNGQTVQFDNNTIQTVYVNTMSGQNTVQVSAVPANVTADILSWGGGASSDTVTVGANGSLSGIQGTVSVSNCNGQTTLDINDSAESALGYAAGADETNLVWSSSSGSLTWWTSYGVTSVNNI